MNEGDYIYSGLLEDYCLGLLSDEEERKVERKCNAYPKLASELQSLRLALEQYTGKNQMWRRAKLRRSIWEAIKKMGDENP